MNRQNSTEKVPILSYDSKKVTICASFHISVNAKLPKWRDVSKWADKSLILKREDKCGLETEVYTQKSKSESVGFKYTIKNNAFQLLEVNDEDEDYEE